MIIYKLKTKVKEKGIWYTSIAIFRFILRKMGIEFYRYYYLTNEIDYEKQKAFWEQWKVANVKPLTYEDFLRGDKTVITEQKLQIIKGWLAKGTYFPFGIVEDNELIYYCWLSLDELEFSHKIIKGKLNADECLFLDSYCSPKYRRKGINTAVNAYHLMKGYEVGKTRSVVFIRRGNQPSLKCQLKVGYKIEFVFSVLRIWEKEWTNYFDLIRKI